MYWPHQRPVNRFLSCVSVTKNPCCWCESLSQARLREFLYWGIQLVKGKETSNSQNFGARWNLSQPLREEYDSWNRFSLVNFKILLHVFQYMRGVEGEKKLSEIFLWPYIYDISFSENSVIVISSSLHAASFPLNSFETPENVPFFPLKTRSFQGDDWSSCFLEINQH